MWDLIVSVPDHCLSFYFYIQYKTAQAESKEDNSFQLMAPGYFPLFLIS